MVYKYNPPPAHSLPTLRRELADEIRRWNDQAGEAVAALVDVPYANERTPKAPATVTFSLRDQERRIHVKAWSDFATNATCCYLILRDMRLAEARGLTEAIMEAYGLLAAPKRKRTPYEVLGLQPGLGVGVYKAQYRELAKAAHPDKGGDAGRMSELNDAIREITGEAP